MKYLNNILRRFVFKFIFKSIYIYKFGILIARYTNFLLPHEEDIHGLTFLQLNPNKVIIDVGASDGLYYKSVRYLGIKNKLYAFEPLKENAKHLKKISKKDKNFKFNSFALGNKNSKLAIYTPCYKKKYINNFSSFSKKECKKNFQMNSFDINFKNLKFKKTLIKQKKLDSFNFNPALIKIDVEGYEKNVLLGGMRTIKNFRPAIYVENNKRKSNNVSYFKKKISKFGYTPYIFNFEKKYFIKYSKKNAYMRDYSYNTYFLTKNHF